jgi:hypothetical protein
MQNWHAMETEAAYRRHEWERAIAASARAEEALPKRRGITWPLAPRLSWTGLRGRLLRQQTAVPVAPGTAD